MTASSGSQRAWRTLGEMDPRALVEARLLLHWAAQPLAALAAAWLPATSDDSHRNLGWDDELGALVSRAGPSAVSAGLRFVDPALLVLKRREVVDRHDLAGRTLPESLAWLAAAAGRAAEAPAPDLSLPEWDMPSHPVSGSGRFPQESLAGCAELARYFADADLVLGALAGSANGASEVRCWPHHFDVATLISFDAGAPGAEARSIGVGLSPGDASYAEPYVYCNPWPIAAGATLPALDGEGTWHREGWTGAVLTGTRLAGAGGPQAQRSRLETFLASALRATRTLIGVAT